MENPPAALAAAHAVCAGWGLTEVETERLVAGDPIRVNAVIRIAELLDGLYSGDLPAMWMTIPNRNPAIGGGGAEENPVRPVDHATAAEDGLWDVVRLLEGYAQGR